MTATGQPGPRKRYRVIYESHCMYGPEFGWEPYKVGETWHATAKAADRYRRSCPQPMYMLAVGLGSGIMVTMIDHQEPDGTFTFVDGPYD